MTNDDEIRKLLKTKAESYDWIDEQRAVYDQLYRLRQERKAREQAAQKPEHGYVYQGKRR
jgi:hypothetical protein